MAELKNFMTVVGKFTWRSFTIMMAVMMIVHYLPNFAQAAVNTGSSGNNKLSHDVEKGPTFPTVQENIITFPPPQPPTFYTKNATVAIAQTGSIARISCIVKHLAEATVSWIRRKDYHLLTVGLNSYTVDERFQPIHYQNSEDWALQIKFVQLRDAGLYECQISSHPPKSIFIDFQVVQAEAKIGGIVLERHLKYGSQLHLTCTLSNSPEIPTYIFWYRNDHMVNYDIQGGFNVTVNLENRTSELYVARCTEQHAGNYTCAPSNARPDNTVVHILSGENPAAMQHGRGVGLSLIRGTDLLLLSMGALMTYYYGSVI